MNDVATILSKSRLRLCYVFLAALCPFISMSSDTLLIVFDKNDTNQQLFKIRDHIDFVKNIKVDFTINSYHLKVQNNSGATKYQCAFINIQADDTLSFELCKSNILSSMDSCLEAFKFLRDKNSDEAQVLKTRIEMMNLMSNCSKSMMVNRDAFYSERKTIIFLSEIRTETQILQLEKKINGSTVFLFDLDNNSRENVFGCSVFFVVVKPLPNS